MKKKYYLCLSATLLLMAFLAAMSGIRRRDAALASRVAPEILRFHVLANSNSPADQALKLEIKELLLEEIQNGFSETARPDASLQIPSKEALCRYILKNRGFLEETANAYIKRRGFDYTASIRLEQCEFPARTYGDMTFPAGTYDAVRVLLGEGKGENFWCVLYPSLCYLDSTHAVIPDESKDILRTLLPEDDFLALYSARRHHILTAEPPRIQFCFKLAELLQAKP